MHVCLFDIDGTLIASGGAGKAALEAGFTEEFGFPHQIAKLSLSGRTDRAIVRDMLRTHGVAEAEENVRRVWAAYLRHLPAHLSGNAAARVLPGISAFLETLRRHGGVAVGLLTGNIRAGAQVKLGHFGLCEHFAFGGYGDDHLDRDDVAREALRAARRRHGETVPAERVWVVGDTPLDVRCARAIGAKAVAVCTGWHGRDELARHGPDLLFDDLSDPGELLARWA
jgi:phosphoglycolate phosphatase-like HAD superfamily hydrolase